MIVKYAEDGRSGQRAFARALVTPYVCGSRSSVPIILQRTLAPSQACIYPSIHSRYDTDAGGRLSEESKYSRLRSLACKERVANIALHFGPLFANV